MTALRRRRLPLIASLLVGLLGAPAPAVAALAPLGTAPASTPASAPASTPASTPASNAASTPAARPGPTSGADRALTASSPTPGSTRSSGARRRATVVRARTQALGRTVSAALSTSGATTVGASAEIDGEGRVVRIGATTALPPASTQKSFTAVSVLLALGRDARQRTEVAALAAPADGRLGGGLWLVAGGDPYLTAQGLHALAADVRAAGITAVAGDLLLDDSRYDARRRADGWSPSFVPGQSGPLSALALDRNAWRSDPAFLADPALPAAERFRDALRSAGVAVTGTVRRASRPSGAHVVAAWSSAPMSAVVSRMLKTSDNFAAELLLKELGRTVLADGSSAGGLAAARQVLGELEVPVGAGADGSGLSALDRQTPAGQVALLRAARRSPAGTAFRSALPIGCVDGTLRARFCGTAAAGRVHAKTGTLSGVRTLAGYTITASGKQVRFAFQLSGVRDPLRALQAIDQAVVALASSRI